MTSLATFDDSPVPRRRGALLIRLLRLPPGPPGPASPAPGGPWRHARGSSPSASLASLLPLSASMAWLNYEATVVGCVGILGDRDTYRVISKEPEVAELAERYDLVGPSTR